MILEIFQFFDANPKNCDYIPVVANLSGVILTGLLAIYIFRRGNKIEKEKERNKLHQVLQEKEAFLRLEVLNISDKAFYHAH